MYRTGRWSRRARAGGASSSRSGKPAAKVQAGGVGWKEHVSAIGGDHQHRALGGGPPTGEPALAGIHQTHHRAGDAIAAKHRGGDDEAAAAGLERVHDGAAGPEQALEPAVVGAAGRGEHPARLAPDG